MISIRQFDDVKKHRGGDMISRVGEVFQRLGVFEQYGALSLVVLMVLPLLSLAMSVIFVVRRRADFFRAPRAPGIPVANRGLLFRAGVVLKNIVGAVLIPYRRHSFVARNAWSGTVDHVRRRSSAGLSRQA